MPPDPTLDHLEKTFVESYRKELDQEENVWRSLPFFAATLALQVAALAQVRDWLGATAGLVGWTAAVLLLLAAGATLAALLFLAWSILPTELRYVAREPDLLRYAEAVRACAEADGATPGAASATAHAAVRATLVEQYALATDHNRTVNQRRAARRNRAGLATLCSVLLFMALVALAVVSGVVPPGPRSPDRPNAAAVLPDGAADPGAADRGTASGTVRPGGAGQRDPASGTGNGAPGAADAAPPAAGNAARVAGAGAGAAGAVPGRGPSAPRRQPGPAPDQPRPAPAHGRAP